MSRSMLFQNLSTEIPSSQILQPDSPEFQARNSSYYSGFQNELKPLLILTPGNVQDVSRIITALHPILLSGDVKLAIRGGGHTPFRGSSNIANGITLDMSGLKGVSVSEDRSTASVSAGENWSDVYTSLQSYGLTTAGGRGAQIGVAGLTLGGGLSFYSNRCGFTCDQVVEFEVVVASGDIVHANAHENSDLWLALRGGLNNYGIVTSFKMKVFKAGNIWGGTIYYQANTFDQLMKHACEFVVQDGDPDTHMMYFIGYGFGRKFAMCRVYSTKGVENPPSLQRFTSLEPQIKQMNTLRTSAQLDFCEELTKNAVSGKRQLFMTCTVQVDFELTQLLHKAWEDTVAKIKHCRGAFLPFIYNPLSKTLLENSRKAGGNAMSISPADGPLFVILIGPIWDSPEDDECMISASVMLLEECKRLASEMKKLHPYIFANYAFSTQDVFAGYGEALRVMRDVSRKWDSDGIFQSAVPGGFKLF